MNTPRRRTGFVSLVGAGPGDPGLLTRKGARCLAEAELVVHDALIHPGTLALATTARRIFVGKRAGRPSVRQGFINALLVRAARRGQRVVRLKGGDPFVFGRGGEEAVALAEAGVPFEVVPGVSSAIAAAGLASIPVTHRGLATSFVVVSGHAEAAFRPVLERLAPNSTTVVVMMGLGHIEQLASLLVARGWNASTPAAVLLNASMDGSDVRILTLGDLARGHDPGAGGDPGTIVIGEVVRLRALLTGQGAAASAVAFG